MKDNKHISLSLNFGEGGTIYGCGHSLDTCLYAFGLTTEEDTWEYRNDVQHDTIERVLEQFKWEEEFIKKHNDEPAETVLDTWHNETSPEIVKRSDYLPGDWLKFCTVDGYFEGLVEQWKEEIEEQVWDHINDWSPASIPQSLLNALEKETEWASDLCHEEWLEGDRSNPGAIQCLIKVMFGSSDNNRLVWDTQNDTINLDVTEDEVRAFYAYDLDDSAHLPTREEIETYMKDKIISLASDRKEAEKIKRRNQQEEWERRQQRQTAEAEREKEMARQRKLEKLGKT